MKKFITAAMAIIIALTSCEKENIIGSGPIETQQRTAFGFTKVDVNGTSSVNITYGTSFKVEVRGYSNLLSSLETKVNGDVLTVGYKNGTSITNDNSQVFITMPLLTKLSTTGDSRVNINSGTANNFEAIITGASTIEGPGFTAKNANVTIEGSGSAAFTVTDRLHAKITGSGVVYYKGNPTVTSQIIGSGTVIKR